MAGVLLASEKIQVRTWVGMRLAKSFSSFVFWRTEGNYSYTYDYALSNELGEMYQRMNAVELLRSDHEVVEGLFAKIEAVESAKKAEIFKQIKAGLDAHAYIEETIFYPAIQNDGDEDVVDLVRARASGSPKGEELSG